MTLVKTKIKGNKRTQIKPKCDLCWHCAKDVLLYGRIDGHRVASVVRFAQNAPA
jgi:hypothetical protein